MLPGASGRSRRKTVPQEDVGPHVIDVDRLVARLLADEGEGLLDLAPRHVRVPADLVALDAVGVVAEAAQHRAQPFEARGVDRLVVVGAGEARLHGRPFGRRPVGEVGVEVPEDAAARNQPGLPRRVGVVDRAVDDAVGAQEVVDRVRPEVVARRVAVAGVRAGGGACELDLAGHQEVAHGDAQVVGRVPGRLASHVRRAVAVVALGDGAHVVVEARLVRRVRGAVRGPSSDGSSRRCRRSPKWR